jgi:hypothetical protein
MQKASSAPWSAQDSAERETYRIGLRSLTIPYKWDERETDHGRATKGSITTNGFSLRYFYRYVYNDFAFCRKFLFLNPPKVGQDQISSSVAAGSILNNA